MIYLRIERLAVRRGKPKYIDREYSLELSGICAMGIGKMLAATWRTLKLTRKSDREEFFLYMKLVFLGFGIVGVIGFIIYFIASEIELIAGVANANASGATPAIFFHLLSGLL